MLKHEKVILLAILFLGAFVRFWGLDFCLLLGREGWVFLSLCRVDEELTWAVALRFFSGDFNPHFFNYPTLLPYAVFVLDAIFLAGKLLFTANGSLESLKQSIAMNPSDLILLSRGVVALLGTLTLLCVYKIAAKLFGKKEGLLSAFFLAFAYLHVRDSHFATTDVPMTFMACLAYLFIIDIFQKGRWQDYLLAGIFSGLAASTKWPAFLLFIPILTAHFLSPSPSGNSRNGIKLAVGLLVMLAAIILGTPFAVLSFPEFWQEMQRLNQTHAQTGWRGIRLGIGWLYHFKFTLWHGLGWPLFLASLGGIGIALKKNRKAALLLLSFVLPYYFLIGKQYLVFMRYMVPLVPFCCVFAGVFASSFFVILRPKAEPWRRRRQDLIGFDKPSLGCKPRGEESQRSFVASLLRMTSVLLGILSLLIVFPSLYHVFWLDQALAKPDSRIAASDWINQNIPQGKKLVLLSLIMGDPAIDIPRSTIGDPYWARRFEWPPRFLNAKLQEPPYHYFRILPETYWRSKDLLDKAQYDYLIVDHSSLPARSVTKEVLQDLMVRFNLVKVFPGAGEDPRMIFDPQDGFYLPIDGAQHTERPGPDIYIFRPKS